MNWTILSPVMSESYGRLETLTLGWQPISEKKNSDLKSVEFRLKFFLCHIM